MYISSRSVCSTNSDINNNPSNVNGHDILSLMHLVMNHSTAAQLILNWIKHGSVDKSTESI
jgi:hypothetical protein